LGTTSLASPALAQNVVTTTNTVLSINNAPSTSSITGTVNATILAGVSNVILAPAIGASASVGINQTDSNATNQDLQQIPTNTITLPNAASPITATNLAGGIVTASVPIANNATISAGLGNSIAAQGIGAQAVASISSQFDNIGTSTSGTPSSNLIDLKIATGGRNDIDANNSGTVTINKMTVGGSALISDGVSNVIGASAIGASAGAGISQSASDSNTNMDLTSLPLNKIRAGDISAINNANATVDISTHPVAITGNATINNGMGNSIGAQAAGASANASISSQFDLVNTTVGSTTTVSTNKVNVRTIDAENSAIVKSAVTIGGNALIGGGGSGLANTGNSIGASAVGAAAGANINQAVSGPASFALNELPDNRIRSRDITATNNAAGAVTATLSQTNATIGSGNGLDGVANSITAQAVGASASASISSRFDTVTSAFDPGAATSRNVITGTPDITATNNAPVTAGDTVNGSALISAGVGNTIGASAVGATASAGISQSVYNDTSIDFGNTLPDNTVRVGDISATNTGAVGAILGIVGTATIGTGTGIDGVGNSIVDQAIGASAVASISSVFENGQLGPTTGFSPVAGQSTNKILAGTLEATNSGTVGALGIIAGVSTIDGGVGNSIAVSATGAGAGAGISQSVSNSAGTDNLQELPVNIVTTQGITATNNAGATVDAFLVDASATHIVGGVGNSIAGQAVGASASAILSSRFDTVATNPTNAAGTLSSNTITTTGNIFALNNAEVMSNVSIASATIDKGVANTIGASAVGASAGAGINQVVSNALASSPFDLTVLPNNTVNTGNIIAINTGEVDVAHNTALSTSIPFTVTGNATITNGMSNSISGQAIGASASASISSRFDGVNTVAKGKAFDGPTANSVTTGFIAAVNTAPVTATVSLGTTGANSATITDGVSNSIGAVAVGASASAGISQSVSNSVGQMDVERLPSNTLGTSFIGALNIAPVNATLTSTGNTTSIPTGMGNSISSQAVGASSGASISSQFASIATTSGNLKSSNTVTTGFIGSLNTATVKSTANLGSAGTNLVSIGGGVGNSIGASAIGASSQSSITQTAYNSTGTGMALGTLPSNTITSGAVFALNGGSTTAALNLAGNSTVSINGGMNNSISAQAIGASAGVSIQQHFNSVNTK
jgi:hypothetical protein